jgi:D-aminoacyl-tRNA deacylase
MEESLRISAIIVALNKDLAAQNIANKLIANYGFKETFSTSLKQKVFLKENVMLVIDSDYSLISRIEALKPEIVIFASRHESKTHYPAFTVHATGNFADKNINNCNPKTLSLAHPQRMKVALLTLKNGILRKGLNSFSLSLEATHHGPLSPNMPVMFVEIGSTKLEWTNDEAGEVVASAIWNSANSSSNGIPSVGFGGGHYAIKHTKLTLSTDYAIGHVFPKYFFNFFDPKVIEQAFEKTVGKCKTAVIDWKGIKGVSNRNSLIKLLKELNVEIIRI